MTNLNIGITQRIIEDNKGVKRDVLEHAYLKFWQSFGAVPVPIPNVLDNVVDYIADLNIQRLILSGGGDIQPRLFGQQKSAGIKYQVERDETERRLLDYAISKKIPVLGICRGAQFINVYFGGKLVLGPIPNSPGLTDHVSSRHILKITDQQARERLKVESAEVNSYHNHGFTEKELASNLKEFAKAADGTVEGFYHQSLPLAGIMWHPEREPETSLPDKKLIAAFLNQELFWNNNQL